MPEQPISPQEPEPLEQAPKYRQWRAKLDANGQQVSRVEPLRLVHKANGELLFALVHVDSRHADGEPLLPTVLLRGSFVAVMTILEDQQDGVPYLLLVKQRRNSTGGWFYEHPAGMTDRETDLAAVAQRELAEEAGLQVQRSELTLLDPKPTYPSPGLLDESGYLFALRRRLPRAEIQRLDGKHLGAAEEQEFIRTRVATVPQALRLIQNSVGQLHIYRYLHHYGLWSWLEGPDTPVWQSAGDSLVS